MKLSKQALIERLAVVERCTEWPSDARMRVGPVQDPQMRGLALHEVKLMPMVMPIRPTTEHGES